MKPKTSKGTNTGKKYIKLKGDEIPTPENEARAREYMTWHAANTKKLEYYVQGGGGVFDEDIFNDTFLRMYDAIALKGLLIKDYTGCFIRAYRNTYLNSIKVDKSTDLDKDIADTGFDSHQYEEVVDTLNNEVMGYVQSNYDDISVSLFEIYVGLSPDISYKKLAVILGYPECKIWPVIGKIKKDVTKRFKKRKDYLLSIVDY